MALGRFCGFKAFADGPLSGSGGGALGEVNGARTGSFFRLADQEGRYR